MASHLAPDVDYTQTMNNRANPCRMYEDLIKASRDGNLLTKDIMENKMLLSAECLVCKNVFRSLEKFFQHKKYYCKEKAQNVGLLWHLRTSALQSQEESKTEAVEYVPMVDSSHALMLKTEVEAKRKAMQARADDESFQISEADVRTSGCDSTVTNGQSRRGRQRKKTDAKSRARLVFEKQMKPPSSMESAASPPIPEVTTGQFPKSDDPRRPRKPPVKLQSPLLNIVDKLQAKGSFKSIGEEPLAQELPVPPPRSEVTPGQPSSCVVSRRSRKMHSPLHAIVDKPPGKVASKSICEEEDMNEALAAAEETCGSDSTAEAQCKEMSLSLADQAGTSGIGNDVQESELSSSASGQTGSSQPALQRHRTSTRERKAPKWRQESEERAKGQARLRSRKRCAPMDSAEKKNEETSKSAKKLRLDDGHGYAKPPGAQNAAAKPETKKRLSCKHCKMTFAHRSSLRIHVQQKHMKKPKVYNCHLCLGKFQYTWGLKRHLGRSHQLSEDQVLACKKLSSRQITTLRKKLQSPSRSFQTMATAAQGSTSSSTVTLTRTDGSISPADSARAVGNGAAERKCGPCPGRTGPQKPKAGIPVTFVELPASTETEAIQKTLASAEQQCEGIPAKEDSSCGSSPQLSGVLTISCGKSKEVEATKRNLAFSAGYLRSVVTQDPSGPAKVSSNPEQASRPKILMSSDVSKAGDSGMTQGDKSNPEQASRPKILMSSDVSKAGDSGMTQGENSNSRADGMEATPALSTASKTSRASTGTLRAVIKRRNGTGHRASSFVSNQNKGMASSANLQSGTVMMESNEAFPDPSIGNFVVEPGLKQVEMIWVNKCPGQPSEEVRKKMFLVVENPKKTQCPDTRNTEKTNKMPSVI